MTAQPPWAADDPIGADRALRRVRWDQRAMAGLAAYYLVVVYVLLRAVLGDGEDDLVNLLVVAVLVALVLLIRNRAAFGVVATALGLLILAAGIAWPTEAPAGLPLLLAQVRLPRRWAPVLLGATSAGLTALAWLFTHWP